MIVSFRFRIFIFIHLKTIPIILQYSKRFVDSTLFIALLLALSWNTTNQKRNIKKLKCRKKREKQKRNFCNKCIALWGSFHAFSSSAWVYQNFSSHFSHPLNLTQFQAECVDHFIWNKIYQWMKERKEKRINEI